MPVFPGSLSCEATDEFILALGDRVSKAAAAEAAAASSRPLVLAITKRINSSYSTFHGFDLMDSGRNPSLVRWKCGSFLNTSIMHRKNSRRREGQG